MTEKRKEKVWICEITCIATKTVLVNAKTRKEALKRLRNSDDGIGVDVHYGPIRAHRVVCRDGWKGGE